MKTIKEVLIDEFGEQHRSVAKTVYEFIDNMPFNDVALILEDCGQKIGSDVMPNDKIMKKTLKNLVKHYLFGRKIPAIPGLVLDTIKVQSTEKIIRFEYKRKFYVYKYETNSNSGLGYIYRGTAEMVYSPYPSECTEEGKEVYQALWDQVLTKNKAK